MTRFLGVMIVILTVLAGGVRAQVQEEVVWVQIEAHPSLATAQRRAQIYAGELADVNGFSLGSGWFGIMLGPYLRSDAEQVLRVYRAEGQIPRDSYIVRSAALRRQYWPPGEDLLNRGAITAPVAPAPAPQVGLAQPSVPADETPREARRNERLLSAQDRRDLQIALQWAGFYSAAIDGAFGAGTRRSMAAWQAANGFESTGVLTTSQRATLLEQYNAPLISAGMQRVRETRSGIEMDLPLSLVAFSRYETPFAHFDGSDEVGARVLLISQAGDQTTLFGLYDIMQTLEIVPMNGPRARTKDRFTLEGRDARIVSHTEVTLQDGEIKGFTLIWPVGDEERRQRVLAAMQQSFRRIDGVLDPAAGSDAEQSVDLVAGLQIRKPKLSRSGFFVDSTGTVVTSSAAVTACERITIDNDYEARVAAQDAGLGVAVLRPVDAMAPISVAGLSDTAPRLQSEVAVAGYSFEGVLGAPTLTFGKFADIRGLRGETELSRLALAAQPGDEGGPVLDTGGRVVGMLLPDPATAQQLPRDVSLAANATAIRNVLDEAGLRVGQGVEGASVLDPEDLGRLATGMTVLISCWE